MSQLPNNIRYIAQRSEELTLRISQGTFPAMPEWVLAERWAALAYWRIHAQIVGASHVAIIEREGQAITEVLVAHPVHSPEPAALHVLSAGAGGSVSVPLAGWTYIQELRREVLTPEALAEWEQRLCINAPNRLISTYPSDVAGRVGTTVLTWSGDAIGLRLSTYHTYPDESVLVTTTAQCWMDTDSRP